MKHGDHHDYNVRQWVLDSAITFNKGLFRKPSAEKVLEDAQKFYGFLFPNNGQLSSINNKKGKVHE